MKPTKTYTVQEAFQALCKYCVYQDRCHQEVEQKLINMNMIPEARAQIISDLIRHDFLNEERFARSFAGGKFRQKSWGRNKIRFELQNRDISDYCIEKGLSEIDDEEYSEKLKQIIEEQFEKYDQLENILAKDKILRYCTGRGYEIDFVLRCLRQY